MRAAGPFPRALIAAVLAAAAVAIGCIGCLPKTPVALEAWNRTMVPIFLIDGDGRRLEVPACGHAGPMAMAMLKVEIHTPEGYVNAFGTDNPAPQFLVVMAGDGGSELSEQRPRELPPCTGSPKPQPSG